MVLVLMLGGCNHKYTGDFELKRIICGYPGETIQKCFVLTSNKFWIDCKPITETEFLSDEIGKIDGVGTGNWDYETGIIYIDGDYENFEQKIIDTINDYDVCKNNE